MTKIDHNLLLKNPTEYLKQFSVEEIIEFLEYANQQYYNTNEPLFDDDMFDFIKEYAKKLDPKNPFFKTVGAPVSNKVLLPSYMASLDKIKDDPKALSSWKTKYKPPYVLSDKLDGISGMFVINKAKQIELYTRGNGEYGQNITSILKYITNSYGNIDYIISKLNMKSKYPLMVRGEFIISKKNWEKIKHLGSNARNIVAGFVNAKEPNPEIGKYIDFVVYEMIEPKYKFHEGLQLAKTLGFNVVDFKLKEDITNDILSSYLIKRRDDSPYEVDGIVVRDDEQHNIVKGKNPKYGFAYKTILTQEKAEVLVYNVEWNVSKDGLIKPTVMFNPVYINNVKIQKATGFNGAFIEKNKIGPGSKVVIIRSGDVIPHIVEILTPSSNGEPSMPDIPYKWSNTHVDIIVEKEIENSQMKLRQMEHFVKTLDIQHIGPGILKKLFDEGIDTVKKLFKLTKKDLLLIEGIKEKSAEKIYNSLKYTLQNVSCEKLMTASNIFGKGFGERKIKAIIKTNPDILKLKLVKKLNPTEGVAEKTEKQFLQNLPKFYAFIKEINFKCNIEDKVDKVEKQSISKVPSIQKELNNKKIIFTGFRNKDLEKVITDLGGSITTSVSKNTDILVAKDLSDNSSKIVKAKELGITIYSKDEFMKKYKL
jgi:DNA ligase (NAD+)